MRQALAHEALESGLDSPPQVGGGAIDAFTAYGVSIARRMEYSDAEGYASWDRDLADADPDPDEEIVFERAPRDSTDAVTDDHALRMSVFGVGAQEYRSVAALRCLPDWKE